MALSLSSSYCELAYDPYYGYYCKGIESFDNFYGSSTRYGGCMTYSRSGANSFNNSVDLWYNPNYYAYGYGDYTHGSVRKPGNNHPHGYDWESKPGNMERIFHPRNAINDNSPGGYGAVNKYYIPTSLKSAILLDESIALGLSTIETVELTNSEKNIVENMTNCIVTEKQDTFLMKYDLWKEKCKLPEYSKHSNPKYLTTMAEYKELKKFCDANGETMWPLLFKKFEEGDYLAMNAIEDIVMQKKIDVLNTVKKGNNLKSSTTSGAVIVRTPEGNTMKFIKELLKSNSEINTNINEGISYSNSNDFNVYPNPTNNQSRIQFDLEKSSRVSILVLDLNGRVISNPTVNEFLDAGKHSYHLNINNEAGIYLVKLIIDGKVSVKKVISTK